MLLTDTIFNYKYILFNNMICKKTVMNFCHEDISLIENYKQAINDETQTWDCHHKLEIELNLTKKQLKEKDLYFNRPSSELIFLTHKEHIGLHGKNRQEEINKIIGEKNRGKHISDETRKKISIANTGKKRSKETRKKISEAAKKQIGPNKGKPMLEETKQKISATMTGRKAPWNSHPMSEETKEKLRNLHKGRKMSEEAKQKMREARLKYWKNKHENQ